MCVSFIGPGSTRSWSPVVLERAATASRVPSRTCHLGRLRRPKNHREGRPRPSSTRPRGPRALQHARLDQARPPRHPGPESRPSDPPTGRVTARCPPRTERMGGRPLVHRDNATTVNNQGCCPVVQRNQASRSMFPCRANRLSATLVSSRGVEDDPVVLDIRPPRFDFGDRGHVSIAARRIRFRRRLRARRTHLPQARATVDEARSEQGHHP